MSPLLFAMVDAVLQASAQEATGHYQALNERRAASDFRSNSRWYAESLKMHLGWWRSTWAGR